MSRRAPMVMGQLGKTQRQQNLGASLLGQERQNMERQAPQNAGLLGARPG